MSRTWFSLRATGFIGVLSAIVGLVLWESQARTQPEAKHDSVINSLPLERALKKARANEKYEMLLQQIKVPKDTDQIGDFWDLGFQERTAYAGFKDLPNGHWVYVYPYWYIWRDLTATPKVKRAWGPEQATGPPDTPQAGDIQTAWASLTPDNQQEWLLLEYAEPVVPEAVSVYETYNPGALYRVTVFKLSGEEVEVWKGKDPTPKNSGMGTSEIKFRVPFKTNRVKIYLDSPAVPGWNEIDAVGLRDSAGKTHWARSAAASSTYAEPAGNAPILVAPGVMPRAAPVPAPLPVAPPAAVPAPPPPAPPPPVPIIMPVNPAAPKKTADERLQELENEVRELKQMIKELRELIKKKS